MSKTPLIPAWIKDFRAEGFTNIWELVREEKHLYGTETLFGDWDAEVLILLQDFSTAGEIRRRIEIGDPNPYRHDPAIMTNRRLLQYAGPLATGETPTTCSLLYGSALVGLLKHGEGLSAKYTKSSQVTKYAQRVLAWTTGKMPNLKVIACCGKEAWETATSTFGLPGLDWRGHLGGHVLVSAGGREVALFSMRHPVNRDADSIPGSLREWDAVAKFRGASAVVSGARFVDESPVVAKKLETRAPRNPMETQTSGGGAPCPTDLRGYVPAKDQSPSAGGPAAPPPGSGKSIFVEVFSRESGATIEEAWNALAPIRARGQWNSTSKVKGGFGVLLNDGWGWWVDRKTRRIYVRKTKSELANVRARLTD